MNTGSRLGFFLTNHFKLPLSWSLVLQSKYRFLRHCSLYFHVRTEQVVANMISWIQPYEYNKSEKIDFHLEELSVI